jgi:hypothetical protein
MHSTGARRLERARRKENRDMGGEAEKKEEMILGPLAVTEIR